MAKPIVVTIPHQLGKAEARQRIEDGINRMGHQFGEGAKLTKAWSGDCLSFSAKVVGQAVAGRLDVLEDAVRTLTRCDIKRSGALLTFIIEGEGFLYKMCRGIVGTLVQIGYGRFPATEVKTMLAHKDRRVAGMNAPAHGLVLWKVFYGKKAHKGRHPESEELE